MATVEEHYDSLLADVYSWMYGGWEGALGRYTEFFAARGIAPRGIAPRGARTAVDLGAGGGFQAIPLARLGFAVTAIDIDRKLLAELEAHAEGMQIETVCGNLMQFRKHVREPLELAKSFYRKLRLSTAWVVSTLRAIGFAKVETALDRGLVVVTATK